MMSIKLVSQEQFRDTAMKSALDWLAPGLSVRSTTIQVPQGESWPDKMTKIQTSTHWHLSFPPIRMICSGSASGNFNQTIYLVGTNSPWL
ncbi:hypothetical protein L210DRAFT_179806 [Boletus edulis BED1]|uniref:Uncharacterized protein n=1 Tax=Boletus edulis BED1 TaxID=1328754 RepID=A0AAD4BHR6_BOLED|nr:hypothetical protein L210DRAFT_179806 [Boletus edulis BED1]